PHRLQVTIPGDLSLEFAGFLLVTKPHQGSHAQLHGLALGLHSSAEYCLHPSSCSHRKTQIHPRFPSFAARPGPTTLRPTMSQVLPLSRRADVHAQIADATATLVQQLAATAVQRDQAGGHAAAEREQIRASGLLALTIPREHGGLGADWPSFY